jgi:taurine dioxygenase
MPEETDALVGDINWHTDQAYITRPNRGKLLYAVEVPEKGGMTGFIDGKRAYDALPDELKRKIDGLHVIQSWEFAQATIARNRQYRAEGNTVLAPSRFRNMAYPIALTHPFTGKRALNVPPLWAAGIVELPGDEGRALLEQLIAHILQPYFAYWHVYKPGDVAVWDNWRFLHAAGSTPGRFVRTLWSVVIQGGPELGVELAA